MITSNFIIAETHALVLSRLGATAALGVITSLRASQMIARIDPSDEIRAIEILTRYIDKTFSFTDATSFAVMERLGVSSALSLDSDFLQFGWQTVHLDLR